MNTIQLMWLYDIENVFDVSKINSKLKNMKQMKRGDDGVVWYQL